MMYENRANKRLEKNEFPTRDVEECIKVRPTHLIKGKIVYTGTFPSTSLFWLFLDSSETFPQVLRRKINKT